MDFRLDGGVGGMEAADAIPLGRMAAEIILGRGNPGRPHAGKPLMIAGNDRIAGVEPFHQPAHQFGLGAMLGAPEKRPRALAEPLHQPRIGQQLEVARNPRLRLTQDLGELRHREL